MQFLLKKKKRLIPKIRVIADLRLTPEYKEWFEAIRAEMRMSRQDVAYEGAASLLEKKKYIIDCIWAGDYIAVYKNVKGHKLSLTGRGPAPKDVMYVYHAESIDEGRWRLYYKGNDDREDTVFYVWKVTDRVMPKELKDSFPTTIRKGIPSNE